MAAVRLDIWLPIITLVLLVIGVYVAKNHRRTLIGAGLGIAVGMVVLALGAVAAAALTLVFWATPPAKSSSVSP